MPLRSGVCRIWNDEKGFGFITSDDGAGDYFCHRLVVEGSNYLNPGDRVEFTIEHDKERKKYKVAACQIVERVEGGAKAVALGLVGKVAGVKGGKGDSGGKGGDGGAYSPYGGPANPYPWRAGGKK
mmetsp:Transcript_53264/g.151933  ORF Transcript_53264/g.151933 Transcript_53264/m.151933 type:complete len:126 (+) Transcript_53264:80-457(+)